MKLVQYRGRRIAAGFLATSGLLLGLSGWAFGEDEAAPSPAVAAAPEAVNPFHVKAGRVTGQILDAQNQKPIGDVTVRIADSMTNHTQGRTVSDADGKFVLAGVQPGQYTLYLGKGVKGQLVATADGDDSKLVIKAPIVNLGQTTPSLLSAEPVAEKGPAGVAQAGFQVGSDAENVSGPVDAGPTVLPPASEPVVPQALPQATPPAAVGTALRTPPPTSNKHFPRLSTWLRSRWSRKHADSQDQPSRPAE